MSSLIERAPLDTDGRTIALDPEEAQRAWARRRVQLNVRSIPLARFAGFNVVIFALLANNVIVFGGPRWNAVAACAGAAYGYCLLIGLFLRWSFARGRPPSDMKCA